MGLIKAKTIKESVIRLGARQITSLAVAASQASLHKSDNNLINSVMQDLWQHSLVCALGCWWLARHTGHQSIVDYAYLAGLLHDVGKLYLLKAMEQIIQDEMNQIVLNRELLLEIFSELHVEQGCRVMDHWNLPSIYRSVVANHHAEQFDHVDSLLAIVRLVNNFSREVNLSLNTSQIQAINDSHEINLLDMDESQCVKLRTVMNSYREISL
jgi:putative nucleotidyltransferase with HDIG domain